MSLHQYQDGVAHVIDAVDLIAEANGEDQLALLEQAMTEETQVREVAKRAAADLDNGQSPSDLITTAISKVEDRGVAND